MVVQFTVRMMEWLDTSLQSSDGCKLGHPSPTPAFSGFGRSETFPPTFKKKCIGTLWDPLVRVQQESCSDHYSDHISLDIPKVLKTLSKRNRAKPIDLKVKMAFLHAKFIYISPLQCINVFSESVKGFSRQQ